ncbi:hypothetical protein CVT24_006600, partial [Panaeolus cyanescens]
GVNGDVDDGSFLDVDDDDEDEEEEDLTVDADADADADVDDDVDDDVEGSMESSVLIVHPHSNSHHNSNSNSHHNSNSNSNTGSKRNKNKKRISELVFMPASPASVDTFTPTQTHTQMKTKGHASFINTAASNPSFTPASSPVGRFGYTRPFAYDEDGATAMSTGVGLGGGVGGLAGGVSMHMGVGGGGVGERKSNVLLGQGWIGEWNEPDIHEVIQKLRALRA